MRKKPRLIFIFLTIPIIAFTLIGGFLGRVAAREDIYRHLRIFEDVVSLIADNYVQQTDLDKVMNGALQGLTNGLDSDSTYLSPAIVKTIEQTSNKATGHLGIEVVSQYYAQIVAVRDNSPADEAGLMAGDYVRAINDETTRRLSSFEIEERLRGQPESIVRLSLLRGNTSEPYDIELVRKNISIPELSSEILHGDIGYLRIGHIADGFANDLEELVATLEKQNLRHLVIDVRNCAGGSLGEGVTAANLFLDEGTMLYRIEQGKEQFPIEANSNKFITTLPMTLLTNYGTADSAELFVSSLLSNGRAQSVGQRTAGRVSLQKLVKLPDGSGLWLSWARYIKASGQPLHRVGVEPTIDVEVPVVELGEPLPLKDMILEKALKTLQTETNVLEDRRVAQLVRAPR
tara:strand:- start:6984 stop:8192 length:1209 start_codon:yes stop_codon:yes gene_type:complete